MTEHSDERTVYLSLEERILFSWHVKIVCLTFDQEMDMKLDVSHDEGRE